MSLICAAAAIIAAGVLFSTDLLANPAAWLSTLLADNGGPHTTWIPNSIWEDLLDLSGDVMKFLMRMVPGIG